MNVWLVEQSQESRPLLFGLLLSFILLIIVVVSELTRNKAPCFAEHFSTE